MNVNECLIFDKKYFVIESENLKIGLTQIHLLFMNIIKGKNGESYIINFKKQKNATNEQQSLCTVFT